MINIYPTWLNTSLVYPQFLEYVFQTYEYPEAIRILSYVITQYSAKSYVVTEHVTNSGIITEFIKQVQSGIQELDLDSSIITEKPLTARLEINKGVVLQGPVENNMLFSHANIKTNMYYHSTLIR